ncbi:MAG: RNA-binding protein [Lachnospiraceae bacterium]|nr:RNA-binding protein [Lachnospiraceae bacterium]
MNAVRPGLATSLAGHDKDTVYVIIREDEAYYYVCDGKSRTVSKPKKKKKIHMQPVIHLRETMAERIDEIRRLAQGTETAETADGMIRELLSSYKER